MSTNEKYLFALTSHSDLVILYTGFSTSISTLSPHLT